jgi:hypothetical protein
VVGSSDNFPRPSDPFDAFVSGLVLNFIPDPQAAIESIVRYMTSGGTIGGYVWDYTDRMEFLRVFWDAASAIDASAVIDEGNGFHSVRLIHFGPCFLVQA